MPLRLYKYTIYIIIFIRSNSLEDIMKRSLIALIALLISGNLMASGTQMSISEVNLGALKQVTDRAAASDFSLTRTSATPSKVNLRFTLKKKDKRCVETRTIRVQQPGYYRNRCYRDHHGRAFCRTYYVRGRSYLENRCVRRALVDVVDSKSIRLNFKKASTLAAGEKEVISLSLSQRSLDSGKFDAAATINGAATYEIEEYKANGASKGLKFISK
jgi:hypothetical protein